MIIICQNKKDIINMNTVEQIILGKYTEILAFFPNNRSTRLGLYETREDAEIAFEMICNAIGKYEKYFMPDKNQIKAYIITKKPLQNNRNSSTGKKPIRRGGS